MMTNTITLHPNNWVVVFDNKSKVSVIMNLAEFIPFVGNFLPVYTVSTLIWIMREYVMNRFLKVTTIDIKQTIKCYIKIGESVYAS